MSTIPHDVEFQAWHNRVARLEAERDELAAKLAAVETPWIERVAELRATISDLLGSHADAVAAHCATNAKLAEVERVLAAKDKLLASRPFQPTAQQAMERIDHFCKTDELEEAFSAANAEIARLKATLLMGLEGMKAAAWRDGLGPLSPPPQETTK
jgi:uncharacterized small protein (DUF1192 family)